MVQLSRILFLSLIIFIKTYVKTFAFHETSQKDSVKVLVVDENRSLIFRNFNNGLWRKIEYISKNKAIDIKYLSAASDLNFEASTKEDISLSKNYVVLHRVDKGTVEDGENSFNHERYECVILDLERGCITEVFSELTCGGEWSTTEDGVWLAEGSSKICITNKCRFEVLLAQINKDYKNRDFSVLKGTFKTKKQLEEALSCFPLENNIAPYNDLGFYLEQSGNNELSTYLLNKIIEKFPTRTVAYVNLGDAYWGLKDSAKAKTAYQMYINLMKKSGKEAKIPKRVLERVK